MRTMKITLAALFAVGLAFGAQAYLGRVAKPPCGGAADVLDPTDNLALSLYVTHSDAGSGDTFMWYINDAASTCGCAAWGAGGAYDCNVLNFSSCGTTPAGSTATVWAIATYYDNGTPGGTHNGHVMIDATCTTENAMGANLSQTLGITSAAGDMKVGPYYANPGGTSGTNSGFDVRWDAVAEYGRSQGICSVGGPVSGGTCAALLPLQRAIIGYNVYRLPIPPTGGVAPGSTEPRHYLYGCLDAACTSRAPNMGWIGFVPVAYGATPGLNLNTPEQPPATTDNNALDQWGVEGRDFDGNTVVDLVDVATIILSDGGRNTVKPLSSAELQGSYAYVVQPVIRGTTSGDADGDTIRDRDLNGDTVPEFISPQGPAIPGLGLTAYDNTGAVHILISGEVTATGTNATPAMDALQFNGVFNQKAQAFDLQFVSALEGNVAGFNLYRSAANDPAVFNKVNDVLIAAKGTALSSYVYSDRIQARREPATYYYKVEAVKTDGSSQMYGPFQVQYTGETEQRRSRGMR